jgi:hypothetical protein
MQGIELDVKPILEEMGFFNETEVSVKEVFEKYLKACPEGIGPLGVFMGVLRHKFDLNVKELRDENTVIDFILSYNPKYDLLNYDPRNRQS